MRTWSELPKQAAVDFHRTGANLKNPSYNIEVIYYFGSIPRRVKPKTRKTGIYTFPA